MTTLLPLVLGSVGEYFVKNTLNKPPDLELNPCTPISEATAQEKNGQIEHSPSLDLEVQKGQVISDARRVLRSF